MEPESSPTTPVSMLIVEDDEDSREILVAIIPKKYPAIRVISALNGRTGLELFKSNTPDIVITDINMPEMGGVEMSNNIRAINLDTKLIVLTADTGKATLEDAVGNGFEVDHFIMKPVDYMELFAAIEQCLAQIVLRQY